MRPAESVGGHAAADERDQQVKDSRRPATGHFLGDVGREAESNHPHRAAGQERHQKASPDGRQTAVGHELVALHDRQTDAQHRRHQRRHEHRPDHHGGRVQRESQRRQHGGHGDQKEKVEIGFRVGMQAMDQLESSFPFELRDEAILEALRRPQQPAGQRNRLAHHDDRTILQFGQQLFGHRVAGRRLGGGSSRAADDDQVMPVGGRVGAKPFGNVAIHDGVGRHVFGFFLERRSHESLDDLLSVGADREAHVLVDVQRRHASRIAGGEFRAKIQGPRGVLMSIAGDQHGAARVAIGFAGTKLQRLATRLQKQLPLRRKLVGTETNAPVSGDDQRADAQKSDLLQHAVDEIGTI